MEVETDDPAEASPNRTAGTDTPRGDIQARCSIQPNPAGAMTTETGWVANARTTHCSGRQNKHTHARATHPRAALRVCIQCGAALVSITSMLRAASDAEEEKRRNLDGQDVPEL